jgi:heme-degrading monooxygenase HmoA
MYRYVWKIKLNNPIEKQSFIDHWRVGSTILQEYPGALGTHLHEVRGEPGSFFAVAEWESEEARDAMQSDAQTNESERAKRWNKLPKNESFGTVIAFFGSEIGVVLPAED